MGLIEPLAMARQKDCGYLLLDGHVRLNALREQGVAEAKCIVADIVLTVAIPVPSQGPYH
ncbi:MAG: ParB-like nuclease [Rhodospirillales bacterium]|nr:ParB-like nuclease [Rhodospirillales bacterium]